MTFEEILKNIYINGFLGEGFDGAIKSALQVIYTTPTGKAMLENYFVGGGDKIRITFKADQANFNLINWG